MPNITDVTDSIKSLDISDPEELIRHLEPKSDHDRINRKKKELSAVNLYMYTEDLSVDNLNYIKELQESFSQDHCHTQVVVYDPEDHFVNPGIDFAFKTTERSNPFYKWSLGPNGTLALRIKEKPIVPVEELKELVYSNKPFENHFIELVKVE